MDDEMFWSELPELPKKMKWPIKLVEWTERPLVYCRSDDAYFNVSRNQLIPFSDEIDTYKNKGIATLRKKPVTLEAFLSDIQWALNVWKKNVATIPKRKAAKQKSSKKKRKKNRQKNSDLNDNNDNVKDVPESETDNIRCESETKSYSEHVPDINDDNNEDGVEYLPIERVHQNVNSKTNEQSVKQPCTSDGENQCLEERPLSIENDLSINRKNEIGNDVMEKDTSSIEYESESKSGSEYVPDDRDNNIEEEIENTSIQGALHNVNSNTKEHMVQQPCTSNDENQCLEERPLSIENDLSINRKHEIGNDVMEKDTSSIEDESESKSGSEYVPDNKDNNIEDEIEYPPIQRTLYNVNSNTKEHLVQQPCTSNDENQCLEDRPLSSQTDLGSNREHEICSDENEKDTSNIDYESESKSDSEYVPDNSDDFTEDEIEYPSIKRVHQNVNFNTKEHKVQQPCTSDDENQCLEERPMSSQHDFGSSEKHEISNNDIEKDSSNIEYESESKSDSEYVPDSYDDNTEDEIEYPPIQRVLHNVNSNTKEHKVQQPCTSNDENQCLEERPLSREHVLGSSREHKVSNDEMEKDTINQNIYVRKVITSNVSKFGKVKKRSTVWNQAHCCKFCHKVKTNISKHLRKHLKKEEELRDLDLLSKKHGNRHKLVRSRWDLIRNEGDHQHNLSVLQKGYGEIILGRRQVGSFEVRKYGPCPHCHVWIKLDRTMYTHQKVCPAHHSSSMLLTARELRIASLQTAGRLNSTVGKPLLEVFSIMTSDEIGNIAMNDGLIITLGNIWMAKNIGNKLKRKYYVSSRMRDAARLLINLRKESERSDLNMIDFLCPEHFDNVVTAALKTGSVDFDDIEDLKSPSTPIKLGYDLKRMAGAKLGMAIKENSALEREKSNDFLKLLEMEWSLKVTKLASTILQTRKFNKEKQLPDPDDIVNLTRRIKEEIKLVEAQVDDPNPSVYRRAVILIQTRLLLYNKRRAGEIEGIRVKEYLARSSGVSNLDKAMRSDMSELDQKLLKTQDVLETRGKYGRGVPVIIPRDCKRIISFLASASVRRVSGIRDDNIYLFPNSNVGVLRSYDSLKSLCNEMDLKRPDKITSVTLRKYTATLSQVLDLSQQEQSYLVNHLGHSMDIHKIHYRQTATTIERVDIAKMMLLQEFNLTAKYSGKQLKDIDLNELVVDAEGNVDLAHDHDSRDVPVTLESLEYNNDTDGYIPGADENVDVADEYTFEEEDDIPLQTQKKKTCCKRVSWTKEEEKEIHEYFKDYLDTCQTPGMKVCLAAIEKSKQKGKSLHKRNWETIKKKVWNIIQKQKK